jgi:hypothetical protein
MHATDSETSSIDETGSVPSQHLDGMPQDKKQLGEDQNDTNDIPPLLRLSLEIRDMIWEHVFKGSKLTVEVHDLRCRFRYELGAPCLIRQLGPALTCRLLSKEARQMYNRGLTLIIQDPYLVLKAPYLYRIPDPLQPSICDLQLLDLGHRVDLRQYKQLESVTIFRGLTMFGDAVRSNGSGSGMLSDEEQVRLTFEANSVCADFFPGGEYHPVLAGSCHHLTSRRDWSVVILFRFMFEWSVPEGCSSKQVGHC